jgi:hypothetical protein
MGNNLDEMPPISMKSNEGNVQKQVLKGTKVGEDSKSRRGGQLKLTFLSNLSNPLWKKHIMKWKWLGRDLPFPSNYNDY